IAPVAAAADFGYVVVWAGDGGIKALRVSDSGAPIDPAPLTVARPTFLTRNLGVAVAGSTILVVWNDQQHILGGRVAAGGAILDEFDSSGVPQSATATSWTNVDSAAVVPLDGGRRFLIVTSREDDHDPWNLPRRAFYRIVEASP